MYCVRMDAIYCVRLGPVMRKALNFLYCKVLKLLYYGLALISIYCVHVVHVRWHMPIFQNMSIQIYLWARMLANRYMSCMSLLCTGNGVHISVC
jgi:hypothetical protein